MFERFNPGNRRESSRASLVPSVYIQNKRLLKINAIALKSIIGGAGRINLYYDASTGQIGIGPADEHGIRIQKNGAFCCTSFISAAGLEIKRSYPLKPNDHGDWWYADTRADIVVEP